MTVVEELSIEARVTEYLKVVNRALAVNRNKFPYRQILAVAQRLFDDTDVAVAVYKTDRHNPHHWFTVEYDDGRFELEGQGKKDADIHWMLKESHVNEVINNPDDFVQHPWKLDLDWLKKTLGLDD